LMMSLLYMEQRITKFSAKELSIMRQVKAISYVSYYVPALISYLIAYFFVFKKGMQNNWKLVFYSLATIAFGVLINFIIVYFVHNSFPFIDSEAISVLVGLLLFVTIIVALLNTIMGIIIKGFVNWFSEVKEKELLANKNHEMELALVKSQLDPHFLFNSINNIDVLIHKDGEKASLFLNKLSDIMRFMLFETKNDKIELSKELTYIEKYIELQRIRSSNSKYVQFMNKVDDLTKLIAPMLFIPFIENAFKYSESFKSEEAVLINLELLNGKLRFECKNRFSESTAKKIESNGLGNDLIQKRISLLYPIHQLTFLKDELYFTVVLELDL
jgi:two-component system LytT family sensor kinase